MARKARKESLDPSVSQVVHVWNRCIRAMSLCGVDPLTKADREHRRQWSRDRLEHLAGVFAVEILTFAVLHNHTHQILRSRPDIARQWSPETVAWRSLMITPKRDRAGNIIEPTAKQIETITSKPKLVEKLRLKLSDISYWMQSYAQYIAVRSNREDDQVGHFWESRFKAHVLLDASSVLRCMMYVDLNPIRAGMADSIEESDYTGAKERLDDLRVHLATQGENQISLQLHSGSDSAQWERLDHACSGWLIPIEIEPQDIESAEESASQELAGQEAAVTYSTVDETLNSQTAKRARRASCRGSIRMSLVKYLWLLDLVGRQQKAGGSGFIPAEAVPLLQQLNIEPTGFYESIWLFGRRSKASKFKQQKTEGNENPQQRQPVVAL